MHVKIFITSIKRFILGYSCLVESYKTHSVERRGVMFLEHTEQESILDK